MPAGLYKQEMPGGRTRDLGKQPGLIVGVGVANLEKDSSGDIPDRGVGILRLPPSSPTSPCWRSTPTTPTATSPAIKAEVQFRGRRRQPHRRLRGRRELGLRRVRPPPVHAQDGPPRDQGFGHRPALRRPRPHPRRGGETRPRRAAERRQGGGGEGRQRGQGRPPRGGLGRQVPHRRADVGGDPGPLPLRRRAREGAGHVPLLPHQHRGGLPDLLHLLHDRDGEDPRHRHHQERRRHRRRGWRRSSSATGS